MPIYVEPGDTKKGTVLPDDFMAVAKPLPGLERYTGADFLITTAPKLVQVSDKLPHQIALRNALVAGELVQRKSGGDFISSIPNLKEIQYRMLQWTRYGSCRLLITRVSIGKGGVLVDGQLPHGRATPENVRGALYIWEKRGGHFDMLPRDELILSWCMARLKVCEKVEKEPIRFVEPILVSQAIALEPVNWVTTGAAFPPGIGRKKRVALAKILEPDRDVVNDPPSLHLAQMISCGLEDDQVPGFGKILTEKCVGWILG